VKVAAIIDRNQERAKLVSKRFNIPVTYPTISDVDLQLDLISICTPPPTHCELTVKSLERGWHVLVEKPMAMTVGEADLMINASEENNAKLCVAHNFLFSHSMTRAKALVAKGRVGDILSIEILQTSNLRRHLPDWFGKLPGGLFFDEAPHAIYLSQFFLGDFTCTLARASLWNSYVQPVRNVEAFFETGRATGHLNMLFAAGRDEWLVTVVGTRSTMNIDLFRDKLVVLGPGGNHTPGEVLFSSIRSIVQEARGTVVSGARWATKRLLFGHDKLVSLFIDSIVSDSPPPVTIRDGKKVVAILCEIARKAGLSLK